VVVDVDVVAGCAETLLGHEEFKGDDSVFVEVSYGEGFGGGAIGESDSASKDDDVDGGAKTTMSMVALAGR